MAASVPGVQVACILTSPKEGLFHGVPCDVLAMLFAYVPYGRRIRSMSLVCKMWRRAVLVGITRLDQPVAGVNLLIPLLPSLTDLEIVGDITEIPKHLVSLRCSRPPRNRFVGPNHRALTHLHVLYEPGYEDSTCALLQATVSSLQSVSVTLQFMPEADLDIAFSHLHTLALNLRAKRLSSFERAVLSYASIEPVASQLTSLSLYPAVGLKENDLGISLPRLKHLSFSIERRAVVPPYILRCTQLLSLHIDAVMQDLRLTEYPFRTRITSLKLNDPETIKPFEALLSLVPSLQILTLEPPPVSLNIALLCRLYLTNLELDLRHMTSDLFEMQRHWPQLTSVRIYFFPAITRFQLAVVISSQHGQKRHFQGLHLPKLCALIVKINEKWEQVAEAAEVLQSLLDCTPLLYEVTLKPPPYSGAFENAKEFQNLLQRFCRPNICLLSLLLSDGELPETVANELKAAIYPVLLLIKSQKRQ